MGEDRRQVGHLPPPARGAGLTPVAQGGRPFGVYVHVPFCASRCGYCNFVTYTAGELGGSDLQAGYADAAIGEIQLAAARLASRGPNFSRGAAVSTVFFGGGTPTLLPPADLVRILHAIDDELGAFAEAIIIVDPQAVFAPEVSRLFIPIGSEAELSVRGGSGYFDVTLSSDAARFERDRFIADALGRLEARVVDRYTAQETAVALDVIGALDAPHLVSGDAGRR